MADRAGGDEVTDPDGVDTGMMTLRQAAQRTHLSATTLRRYIKSGRLRARLVPGRYGPEYVVDDHDLQAAGLSAKLDSDLAGQDADQPAVRKRPPTAVEQQASSPPLAAQDLIPGILYRELMMKHEQLLVHYGMLRVSGQQLYEIRQEAERRAEQARDSARELERLRDRHAREIGQLRARLRKAELEIASREEQMGLLERKIRQLEIRLRNRDRASSIEQAFQKALRSPPEGDSSTAASPPQASVSTSAAGSTRPADH
ncbi:MAG: hypothetical protein JSV80_03290 [Acidobacteriota bacterium]|nr:MAG: hypothetical protein JSV80_03290 [Acidobacteriota bacterium]